MSTRTWPSPAQASQRPPGTLNEKSLAVRPRARASRRGREQLADRVEGLQVGDGVGARACGRSGDWSTTTTSSTSTRPRVASCAPTGRSQRPLRGAGARAQITSCTRVDLPEPETPVTQVSAPSGMRDVDALEVVGARAAHAAGRARARWRRCAGTGICSSPRRYLAVRLRPSRRSSAQDALEDDAPALLPRSRAEVDDVVGDLDDGAVVLDHHARCCPGRAAP